MSFTAFLVLLRIISNSYSGVFQKKLSKNLNASYINFISYLLLSILCALIFLKFFNFNNPSLLPCALFTGLIGAIGNAFQIKALKEGELSILAPINSYKIIFSLIFSFLILKEIPSAISFIGIILIISGSYFIFDTTKEGFSFKLLKRKDIQYRIIAVFFTAIEAIFIKKMIILSNSLTALFLWASFSCLFSLAFIASCREKIKKITPEESLLITLLACSMGIMQLTTNCLFKIINVSCALSLFQLSSILSIILGYTIFKEQNLIKKLTGCTIMLTGACLILLQP